MRTGSSVFHRADGRWEARYQKARDDNGKIVYGYVYGSTQEEAEKKRSDALLEIYKDAADTSSPLPSINPSIVAMNAASRQRKIHATEKYTEPLTDLEVSILDDCLEQSAEPAAIGLYLSLHMGISVAEAMVLRFQQLDMPRGIVRVEEEGRIVRGVRISVPIRTREIVMPPFVREYLAERQVPEMDQSYFVVTGDGIGVENNRTITAAYRRITRERPELKDTMASALRCTFIRRCLEANMNIESVALITGMEKALLYRYYAKFLPVDPNAILRIKKPEQNEKSDKAEMAKSRHLNLLIVGAGSHGQTVYETAQRLGIFHNIRFLDDEKTGENIVGICADSEKLIGEYACAFVAIGNNMRRKLLAEQLRKEGYLLPRIIHPSATVSQNAVIGDGTIIMAQATVDAAQVGEMCIIASNALVSRGAAVGDYCHLNSGAIVVKDAKMLELTLLRPGEIYQ